MTFTSIPPSLRPVVEDVARLLCKRRNMNPDEIMDGNYGNPPWWTHWENESEAAILAFLNACVERGVGWRIAEYMPLEPDMPFENPAFVLNLGATDDTA